MITVTSGHGDVRQPFELPRVSWSHGCFRSDRTSKWTLFLCGTLSERGRQPALTLRGDESMTTTPASSVSPPSPSTTRASTCDLVLPVIPANEQSGREDGREQQVALRMLARPVGHDGLLGCDPLPVLGCAPLRQHVFRHVERGGWPIEARERAGGPPARVAAFSGSGKRANRKSAIRVSPLLTADVQCTNRWTCTDVRCRARLLNLPTLTSATVDCAARQILRAFRT